jgi:hypothetical protein
MRRGQRQASEAHELCERNPRPTAVRRRTFEDCGLIEATRRCVAQPATAGRNPCCPPREMLIGFGAVSRARGRQPL